VLLAEEATGNDYRTLNSSRFLPDAMSLTSQRGILPLPDHVSEGLFGFRNFGWTLGMDDVAMGYPPDLRPSSSSCFCSLRVSSFSLLDRTSMILWCSSQSASSGIFSRSLFFISNRQRGRACRYWRQLHWRKNSDLNKIIRKEIKSDIKRAADNQLSLLG
jgi:hypothetical protein